jgi:hypothetical protein
MINEKTRLTAILVVLLGLFGIWLFFLTEPLIFGQVYLVNGSVTVNTTVNITNAAPWVTRIVLDPTIDLTAYNTTQVYCNVSTYDYDNDTLTLNATLFINGVSQPSDVDDGNNHYTNTSCASTTSQNPNMNWTCVLLVQYYANNNSNWQCNVTVSDGGKVPASNESSSSTINPLIAIRMPAVLDYGDLAVGDTSPDTPANITNAGNRDANISVKGYADTEGDGLAFNCSFGTIDLAYEKYNTSADSGSFWDMFNLTSTDTEIYDFYVPQRTGEGPNNDSTNITHWRVQIPVGAGGVCNGKIVFTASDRSG